jgi:IS30 family transposase
MDRDARLGQDVLDRLSLGWSPAQIASRQAADHGQAVISRQSIYRFLYAQVSGTNDEPGVATCRAPSSSAAAEPARTHRRR